MDKGNLKLIVRNLELLVDSLKSEVYSDIDAYQMPKEYARTKLPDYDEVFEDDD